MKKRWMAAFLPLAVAVSFAYADDTADTSKRALEIVRKMEQNRVDLAHDLAPAVCAVFRGQGGGSTWAGGASSTFCIDSKKSFEFTHGDKTSCRGGNRKRVKMTKFKLRHGTVTYNFR